MKYTCLRVVQIFCVSAMSHPELLGQKFQNLECRGQSLLPGRGVRRDLANWTRKNSFFSFCVPPEAAREERERSRGHPCNPVKGLAALCNPACQAARFYRTDVR